MLGLLVPVCKHKCMTALYTFYIRRMFVLLSDSCLPIVSFDEAREELMGGNSDGMWDNDESVFDMHQEAQQKAQRKYLDSSPQLMIDGSGASGSEVRELLHGLLGAKDNRGKPDGLWAHSQWCVLSRRHAEMLCDMKEEEQCRRNLFLHAYTKAFTMQDVSENITLASDELFTLSYLRDYGRRNQTAIKWRDGKTTYGRCCLDGNACKCGSERAKHPM